MTSDALRNKGFATAAPAWHSTRRPRDVDSLSESLRDDWDGLAAATTSPEVFNVAMLTGLPEPVRRWLTHAIAPGTPLRRVAVLHQQGQIKVGRWQRYEADWALAPPYGFIWTASTRLGPLSIRGFDRYTRGSGEMRWRLFGRIPFIKALGPDVTRSAIGRLAGEFCFVPATALAPAVRWEELDDHRAVASIDVGDRANRVTITVDDTGSLDRVDVPRWGQPDGKTFGEHLFTALLDGPEATFDGFTIDHASYR